VPQYTCPKCGKEYVLSPQQEFEPLCTNCQKRASAESYARLVAFGPKPIITRLLIGANVAVYLIMVAAGISWIEPSQWDLIRFGADFGPLTLTGQWWRLLTNMFVHVGLIHLALNMWCLWVLGDLAERFMGRKAFTFLYFASGLTASLGSLAWDPARVSAGASGAIFGAVGGMVSYLYLKKAPIDLRFAKERLKSLSIFIGINLIWGLQSGIDNAAHVGGLIGGLALGAVMPPAALDLLNAQAAAAASHADNSAMRPQPPGVPSATGWRLDLMAIATAIVLVLAAYAVAHYRVPKLRAERTELIAGFANGTADLIPVLENRVQKNPKDFPGWALLAQEHLFADDAKAAIEPFQKALALNPRSASTHHNLAVAYLGTGDYQSAKEEIAKANGHGDAGAIEFILGIAEDGLGHPEIAIQHYEKAAAARPDLYQAEFAQAEAYMELGRIEEARALYKKIQSERPDDTRAAAAVTALNSGQVKTIADFNPPQMTIPCNLLMDLPQTWPYLP
jgi:membrane associated rhomboid family serine protease/Flp pilus assembly protein TadD